MKKTIIISESSLVNLSHKLQPNIIKHLKDGNTSLGKNHALPEDDIEFLYGILKNRNNDVCNMMLEEFPDIKDITDTENEIRKLIYESSKLERKIRPQLCTICENTINRLFPIPENVIEFSCELVDGVKLNNSYRRLPEAGNHYEFDDAEEISRFKREVDKRRMIDCLIMGASYNLSESLKSYWSTEINNIDENLVELYRRIDILEQYLVMQVTQKITDDSPKMNAFVSVRLGHDDKKTEIKSEAILFPYLLRESIRGLMELFSSHGLPKDNALAMEVISRSDFLVAEPWDMRLGIPIWNIIWDSNKYSSRILPYVFTDICKLGTSEFNDFMRNALLETKKAKRYMESLADDAENSAEYNMFRDRMYQKNLNKSIIEDDTFTINEIKEL